MKIYFTHQLCMASGKVLYYSEHLQLLHINKHKYSLYVHIMFKMYAGGYNCDLACENQAEVLKSNFEITSNVNQHQSLISSIN